MRAILIDPAERSIEYVETAAELREIYSLLGCDAIDWCCPFPRRLEAIFVSDDGALQNPPLPSFAVDGYHWTLFGRGLVLGYTENGANRSTHLTIEQIRGLIEFTK
jgi:hypothetical protein